MRVKYQIVTHYRVRQFIDKLDRSDRARVDRLYDLFEIYGTYLPSKYLKKVAKSIWELRPGKIRLFLTMKDNEALVVHGIYKKTQKTPKRDLELAVKRVKEVS